MPVGERQHGETNEHPQHAKERNLLGVVGAIGVGYFIYGSYLYLTASGAPHQMERGKSAMMTSLAGIVLAMVAFGVVELVMDAVSNPVVDIDDVPEPE